MIEVLKVSTRSNPNAVAGALAGGAGGAGHSGGPGSGRPPRRVRPAQPQRPYPVGLAAMGRKFVVRTFGCQMNEHDSERIAGQLRADGLEAIDDVEQADVIV